MKSLLLSVFAFASVNVLAAEFSHVREGVVRNVSPATYSHSELCPRGMVCVTNGTIVSMSFTPNGCLDKALEPSYKVVGQDVYVHATVNSPKENILVKCVAMPIVTEQLQLINVYPPLRLHFLGTNGVVDIR